MPLAMTRLIFGGSDGLAREVTTKDDTPFLRR